MLRFLEIPFIFLQRQFCKLKLSKYLCSKERKNRGRRRMISRCSELVYIELSYYFVPTVVLKKERSGLRD